ncbi:MAG: DUF2062 domain-containing protein [Rhodospirillales bacterium]
MFRRREKEPLGRRVANFFWPSLGWSRTLTYFKHRLGRLPGTPHSIACGFAHGAAISFTPFVGFHILLGGIFSWISRGNILAAAIGTVVGNPWTFPFIWVGVYQLGGILLGGGHADADTLDFETFFLHMVNAVQSLNIAYFGETAWPVFWPMLIGSLPCYLVVWALFYYPLRATIRGYHHARAARLQRAAKARERAVS